MNNAMGNVAMESVFKFNRIAIENKKEGIGTLRSIQRLQLTQHSRAITSGARQVAVRQNKIQ